MTRLMLLVIVLLLGMPAHAVELGVYYCVIERMVGIQPEGDLRDDEDPFDVPRFAGEIKPDPARFVLRISEFSAATDAYCTGFKDDPDMQRSHHVLEWPFCEPHARYRAELPASIGLLDVWPLVSVNGATFYGKGSMVDIHSGRFRMLRFGIAASYLSEGTCHRFEQ